ncbi:MAG: hypothetical protein PWQ61_1436 [Betaproteobacteria bacterium]|nr:hypothetical protein [Betaproteobacteria bacterium]
MSLANTPRRARISPFVVLIIAFTILVTGLLWWQAQRSQLLVRQQVLLQAEQRSLHLADAMAGQVQAQLNISDLVLRELREHWASEPLELFDTRVSMALGNLPPGLASHVSVTDAAGYLVYNSLGLDRRVYLGDSENFLALRAGGDELRVSTPVRSRLTGQWTFLLGRPLVRDGRFEGVIYLLVQSDQMAQRLGTLALSQDDVVSLIHPGGAYLARSKDNDTFMGQQLPPNRPFLADPLLVRGTYRVSDARDGSPRTYGWHRLEGTGLVISIGLADRSVLASLTPALESNLWVTGLLSLLLLGSGGLIARYQLTTVQQQQAMARSESTLKEAQQVAHLGNWELDHATGELHWSEEVFRMFELDPAQTRPSFETFLAVIHPDDRSLLQKTFDASVRDRQTYNLVHRLLLPDGRVKHVRERGMTEYDGDRPVRSFGTVLDVTEVRQAQLALQDLNDQLEQRVAERTEELTRANRELEAFSYSVSHDLRTPLRSIQGFACVLEEQEGAALSPAGRRHLKRIQDGSRRMGQLITDLLSLAHLDSAPLHKETLDLSRMAHEIAEDLQRSDPAREVRWQIEDRLTVLADPGLMRMALQHLLSNAWKYTGRTTQPRISLTREVNATSDVRGENTFCVRDNGAGFDMAYAAQLFQPFKRLHAPQEFEGSGVGLVTVSRIIHRHGGTVRGEGALGAGAAFFFTLPGPATHPQHHSPSPPATAAVSMP